MSRFYFDLHNGEGPTRDDVGKDLPSREAVAKEISKILLDVAGDEIGEIDRLIVSLSVRDDQGRTVSVASLTFNNEWVTEPPCN